MTYLDPAEFFLEDHVEEACVEFADSGGRGGDVHRILTTAQNHVLTNRGNSRRVHRTLRLVCLPEDGKREMINAKERLEGKRNCEHGNVHYVSQTFNGSKVLASKSLAVKSLDDEISIVPVGERKNVLKSRDNKYNQT